MGRIIYIQRNPNKWQAINANMHLKDTEEELYKVRYGTIDDEIEGILDLEMLMRKSVYENLINHKFFVDKNLIHTRLRIIDSSLAEIQPVVQDVIY